MIWPFNRSKPKPKSIAEIEREEVRADAARAGMDQMQRRLDAALAKLLQPNEKGTNE